MFCIGDQVSRSYDVAVAVSWSIDNCDVHVYIEGEFEEDRLRAFYRKLINRVKDTVLRTETEILYLKSLVLVQASD
jgi:hypothetical protein